MTSTYEVPYVAPPDDYDSEYEPPSPGPKKLITTEEQRNEVRIVRFTSDETQVQFKNEERN